MILEVGHLTLIFALLHSLAVTEKRGLFKWLSSQICLVLRCNALQGLNSSDALKSSLTKRLAFKLQ